MRADGTHRVRLDLGFQASWSADGKAVYIAQFAPDCRTRILSVHPDGSGARVLSYDLRVGDAGFRWSPDGAHVMFVRYDQEQPCKHASAGLSYSLWMMNTDGSNQRRVITHVQSASWAPDSQHIGVLQVVDPNAPATRLIVADVSGRATFTEEQPDKGYADVMWAPLGDVVVVSVTDGSTWKVAEVSVSAPHVGADLTPPGWDTSSPAFAPDGRRFAFLRRTDDGRELIWLCDSATCEAGRARQLSSDSADDSFPVWSADGSDIATSGIDTNAPAQTPHVFLIGLDGSRLDLGAGQEPSWQPQL